MFRIVHGEKLRKDVSRHHSFRRPARGGNMSLDRMVLPGEGFAVGRAGPMPRSWHDPEGTEGQRLERERSSRPDPDSVCQDDRSLKAETYHSFEDQGIESRRLAGIPNLNTYQKVVVTQAGPRVAGVAAG